MDRLTEIFLEEYKSLEEAVSIVFDGRNIYNYEQHLSLCGKDSDAKKLQLCRLTRNFISHESKPFIKPTKEMDIFLRDLTLEIKRQEKTVRDVMTRVKPVNDDMTFRQAALQMKSKSFLPIIDDGKRYLGAITTDAITKAVQTDVLDECIKDHPKLMTKMPITDPKTPLACIDPKTECVVTDNGWDKGVYKGVLYKNKNN